MKEFKQFLKVVVGAVIIWLVGHNMITIGFDPITIYGGTVLLVIPFIFILFSGIIGEAVFWGASWIFNKDNWIGKAEEKPKFPCKFDHNGECLVCDCGFENCAYDRWVKRDYTYENEAELDKMFEGYKKIKTYPDDDKAI